MVVFFEENDLISFGTFLLSEERKVLYKESPEMDQTKLDEYLSQVNNLDLQLWSTTNE